MEDRLDLLLIYPPWAALEKRAMLQNCLPPLGILSIASCVRERGFTVQVLDVHAERLDDVEVRARVTAARPRFVGISVLTNMAIPAHAIAKLVKEIVPDCVLICGGTHAEAMPEAMLSNSAFDAVVRGDGEEAMLEIMQRRPFAEVPGLSFRDGDKVLHNAPRPVEMNLDRYPMPAYDLVNFANYFPAVGSYRNLPAINMLMTRGCPGKCTFCNSANTVLRSRSAASVVEQIKHLRYQYGIRQVQFYDDTFTVAKKTVLDFCRLMVEQKVDVTWTAYVRGDCFSDDMARAMKGAGCHQVLMGIETGDERIMKNIGKPIDKQRYLETVRIAHAHGIEVRGSFIIGNVGETHESMMATLNFAKDLNLDLFQLNISTPYPGTQLYRYALENNMLVETDWSEYGQGTVLVRLPDLTPEQIYAFEKFAFRSFYMRPSMMLRQLKRIIHPRQIRDLILAFGTLVLGAATTKNPKWDCWKARKVEDFADLKVQLPAAPRLTFQLRQERVFQ